MDDETIIKTLVRDEEQGYALLLERYTAYVAAVIAGVASGRLTACDMEELAADVFFRIWKNRDKLKSGSLKAYIARTARNAAIDSLRKNGDAFLPYEDDVLCVTHSELPDELAIVREQKRIVRQAVDAMGEPEREIFIRFYYFGEKVKTIAQTLKINAATVKTKLHRTRSALRGILLERGYGCE